jgi:molybdenum cofactor cytidylyltransferase
LQASSANSLRKKRIGRKGQIKRVKIPGSDPATVLGAVILAAGRSTRMGRPKLLLPWGQSSVLGHIIEQWRLIGAAQIAVVVAEGDLIIETELNRLAFTPNLRIYNPAPNRGMFSSIQCSAAWPRWQPELTHWAIVLGDQPHLRQETLRAIVVFSAGHPDVVCQPAWKGHRRHPVLLPKAVFRHLATSDARDFKQFLAQFPASLCDLDDPGLDLDLDLPEDYEKARGH